MQVIFYLKLQNVQKKLYSIFGVIVSYLQPHQQAPVLSDAADPRVVRRWVEDGGGSFTVIVDSIGQSLNKNINQQVNATLGVLFRNHGSSISFYASFILIFSVCLNFQIKLFPFFVYLILLARKKPCF